MRAIIKTVDKVSGEIFEDVANDVINVIYSDKIFTLVKSDGTFITYAHSSEHYKHIISVV